MTEEDWLAVIGGIGVAADCLFFGDAPHAAPPAFALRGRGPGPSAPSRTLWPRDETAAAALGVIVQAVPADVALLALRLASVAVERELLPVILTTRDQTGFEPYGFRIERLTDRDGAPDAAELAELSAFWDFAVIIDAADIVTLG